MMNNFVRKTMDMLINKWGSKDYKGVGCIHCIKPMSYSDIVVSTIKLMKVKKPNLKVIIVTGEWAQRSEIFDKLDAEKIDKQYVDGLTYTYIKAKYNYSYDLAVIVGVNEWHCSIDTVFNRSRFKLMLLTKNDIPSTTLSYIYTRIPPINNVISSDSINNLRMTLPVEEVRIGVNFITPNEKQDYDTYDEYIYKTIQIFGSFDNINAARVGTKDGRSAAAFRQEIAEYNGWSEEMDTSIPFNKQIDDYYNPNLLAERASTCYTIMKKRADICTDSNSKLEHIAKIIRDNPNTRFLIISKRGEFAATITNYLNEVFGYTICGDYHDKIEKRILTDENGVPITVKSKKSPNYGKPVWAAAERISSLNLAAFNDNRLRVLSIKNHSSDSLETNVDAWIITSPLCDNIDEIRYRFKGIEYDKEVLQVYKLYMIGTMEEKTIITKEKTSPNHKVVENVNTDFSAEIYNDIIC